MTERNWLRHCLLMLARSDAEQNATDVVDALDAYLDSKKQVQNFCSRCGKRTPDLTTIHTCTPPLWGNT